MNQVRTISEIERFYTRLDRILTAQGAECQACGKCCDFAAFDHRLYVTSAELLYFSHMLAPEKVRPMAGGLCPWSVRGKCMARAGRFAGCRIFHCNMDSDNLARISEEALDELKKIGEANSLPHYYVDLSDGLRLLMNGMIA